MVFFVRHRKNKALLSSLPQHHQFNPTNFKTKNMLLLLISLAILACSAHADNYVPIFVPGHGVTSKLVLFVPGGKVPPSDYVPILSHSLQKTTGVAGVIVHCGALNLCDPLGQLPSLMDKAVNSSQTYFNATFRSTDIFIVGHSLGGVGARHYADTKYKQGPSAFAGLALLGTQYNGDHEDFKGTLGYPSSLGAFPSPLLALLGELDMVPTSHAALLFRDYDSLPSPLDQAQKTVIVVAGMDHSQFCSPFNVSGDLVPEITNSEALRIISDVMSSWMNSVLYPTTSKSDMMLLSSYVENSTRPMTAAFLEATKLEAAEVCRQGQELILRDLPNVTNVYARLQIDVHVPNSKANLEHAHTNYSWNGSVLHMNIASYPYYPSLSSWNPIAVLSPTYSSASDISCKMISADRIAQQFELKGYYPQKSVSATCTIINQASIDTALAIVAKHWPAAIDRFHKRGRNITVEEDSSTIAGPQFVFLSSLKFDETKPPQNALVKSPELYSSISSPIYPGNYYCKVLSPARVVEWIQSRGLDERF